MDYQRNAARRLIEFQNRMARAAMPAAVSIPDEDMTETENDCLAGKSLAMVYSPYQKFRELYEPEEGLSRGTIFRELDKPFYGRRNF